MNNVLLSRRESILTAAAALTLARPSNATSPLRTQPTRSLRLAHITDTHIQPELNAGDGVGACLRHLQNLKDAPTLVMTGGDLVMDSFAQGFDRTKAQWDLFSRTLKQECSLEINHCLGNHDIWGWNKAKSKTSGTEKGWGKAWACEALGLARPYYSIQRGGWRLIVLDSVQPNTDAYLGGLDDEQFAWLEQELAAHPSEPTLVISHIPIFSIVALLADGKLEDNEFKMPAASVFKDGKRLRKLFAGNRQVKACVSGHIHMIERIDLDGVSYICDGAVCGAWWKGAKDRCPEGYGLFDLFADGSFAHQYVTYDWKAAT